MAANKFATMLHKNTNRITVILIYAVLEWILIFLLLLNSFFSYMIIKFAEYFGLKPPCPLCSRVDHLFEDKKTQTLHSDRLCESHATEISKLGFCSNHQKLVESQDMCEDCSSSRPDLRGVSKDLALFPWMKEIELIKNGEILKCSCCGVNLENKFSTHNYILIKPCFDDLGYTQKGNLVIESTDDDLDKERSDFCEEKTDLSDVSLPISGIIKMESNENDEECLVLEKVMKDQGVQVCLIEDSSFEFSPQHLDFFVECSGHKLVPVELIDSITEEDHRIHHEMREIHKEIDDEVNLNSEEQVNEEVELVVENNKIEEGPKFVVLDSMEMEEDENGFAFYTKESHLVNEVHNVQIVSENVREEEDSDVPLVSEEVCQMPQIYETEEDHRNHHEMREIHKENDDEVNEEVELVVENNKSEEGPKFAVLDSMGMDEDENGFAFYTKECHLVNEVYNVQIVAENVREEEDSDVLLVSEEFSEMPQINETEEEEVSIGNEIPVMNLSDELTHEEPSASSAHFHEIDEHGPKEDQETLEELKLLSVEFDENVMNNLSSMSFKLDEIEEEKVPETPTSTDSFHQLHKKLLLFEKKDFGTESLDGSVVSELEGGDIVSSIEHLKSALKAERKALHALYTELEEERSASAVAANQTMAMINKLQEEKSAMQMEALQYQRMMEEQSEYDQEALQLLNELMVKREKEKQELEKELEVYRKKLSEYEAKEKTSRMLMRRSKDGSVTRSGFSSASCSNPEDSEELSIDLNQEAKEYDSFFGHQECEDHNKVHVDAFLELEESFVDFEEERMSILEQLKMLEEKLISMDDEDVKKFEDVKPMEDSYRENGNHTDGEIDEHVNGFSSEMNGKLISKAEGKGLLPLFDAMSGSDGDVMLNGHENGFHSNGVHDENKNLEVEEELDHLHERLQALEADREFLKNCISSLKKGDKGMDLLHEILQHLRDLKNVDLRVRSSSNGLIL